MAVGLAVNIALAQFNTQAGAETIDTGVHQRRSSPKFNE
jgi:hypothetical protein